MHDHLVDAEELLKSGKGKLTKEQIYKLFAILSRLDFIQDALDDKN